MAGSCFDIEVEIEREEVTLQGEQAGTKSTTRSHIKLDHFHAIVQLAQLVFLQEFNFKVKLPLPTELKPHAVLENPITFSKHYRALFRQFISPNAP